MRASSRNGYTISDGWLRWNRNGDLGRRQPFPSDDERCGFTSYREAQDPDTMTMLYMMIGADAEVKTISTASFPLTSFRRLRAGCASPMSRQTASGLGSAKNLFYPFQGLEDRVGEDSTSWAGLSPVRRPRLRTPAESHVEHDERFQAGASINLTRWSLCCSRRLDQSGTAAVSTDFVRT